MPTFRIRHGAHEIELPAGEFVVGRLRGCQLVLDDPLISRRHALFRVFADALTVEDLQSSNGVHVNGRLINGPTPLKNGDLVVMGEQRLEVRRVEGGPTATGGGGAARDSSGEGGRSRQTITREIVLPGHEDDSSEGTTQQTLSSLVDKAIAVGRMAEAEVLVAERLHRTLVAIERGQVDRDVLNELTRYALMMAGDRVKPAYLDWIFQAHHAARSVLPASTVDELHVVARKIRYVVTSPLKAYVAGLTDRIDTLTPAERFTLNRLQGLMRVLMA